MIDLKNLFDSQKAYAIEAGRSDLRQRKRWLDQLENAVLRNRQALEDALYKDFKKPATETSVSEIFPLLSEIRHTRRHLADWMRPEAVHTPLLMMGTTAKIEKVSKGVCLIIAPWNYSILLTLGPLVSAIAAGNTAILKPSEYTPSTSGVLARIVRDTFEPRHVALVEGGVETSQRLLELPFNHIFFTGSPRVGRIVMRAAAEHLASVTLELGGKSPCIVTERANLDKAAERIAWGKGLNAGQTCIAPDFLFVHETVADSLASKVAANFNEYYRDEMNYTGIVNEKHKERLEELGSYKPSASSHLPLKIIPLHEVKGDLMTQEIFGPILPLITYTRKEQVTDLIYAQPAPLVIYLFDRGKEMLNALRNETRSGAIVVNHNLIHFAHSELPFGGVNNSGLGQSGGESGFHAFSNKRPILRQKWGFSLTKLVQAPYTEMKKRMVDLMIKYF